jgi:hypothetical protein
MEIPVLAARSQARVDQFSCAQGFGFTPRLLGRDDKAGGSSKIDGLDQGRLREAQRSRAH